MQARLFVAWLLVLQISGCLSPTENPKENTSTLDYCSVPVEPQPSNTWVRLIRPSFAKRQSPGDEWAGFERGTGTARLMQTTTILTNFSLDKNGCALFKVPTSGKVEISTCIPNSVSGDNCWQKGECFYTGGVEFFPKTAYEEFNLTYHFSCMD